MLHSESAKSSADNPLSVTRELVAAMARAISRLFIAAGLVNIKVIVKLIPHR